MTIEGPGGFLTHRDMWPIQRELGAADARDRAVEREMHGLATKVDSLSSQVTSQIGGMRAELLTITKENQYAVQREIGEVIATIQREQNNQRLMLAIVAIAAVGGPAALKLLGVG